MSAAPRKEVTTREVVAMRFSMLTDDEVRALSAQKRARHAAAAVGSSAPGACSFGRAARLARGPPDGGMMLRPPRPRLPQQQLKLVCHSETPPPPPPLAPLPDP
jgi:hypothetical protein